MAENNTNYDPNAEYRFTDANGNTFVSKGDNGYVWQAMTSGVPIYVNQNGDWYTEPYLESDGKKITAHIPEWFRGTPEYESWSQVSAQIPNLTLTKDRLSQMNDYLKALGSQGVVRYSLKNEIASYGVKNPELQNKYYDWMVEMGTEGAGKGDAKLNGLFDNEKSVAEVARMFKDMSKEDLSTNVMKMMDTANKGLSGTWDGSEEEMLAAVSLYKILNYVDDNYKNFGKDEEFNGLLQASAFQKFRASQTSMMQTLAENFPIINLFTRTIYGIGEAIHGRDFSFEIEKAREGLLDKPDTGGGLEGRDAAMAVGNVVGTVGNIAGTMELSVALGNVINAKTITSAPGTFLSKMGDFAKTIPGSMVTDFALNDIPVDLMFFATDWARTGSFTKAIYNPEEEQPLFGIPLIGNFGPKAAGGLATNLLGDAIIDVSLPVLGVLGNTSYKKLDQWTSGGVTRTREKAAITNLKVQQKLTDIPVLGDVWKKFMNYMMGAENASFIREARKTAIIENSMEPYIRAQNNLTSYNHAGMDVIHPLYKKLDDDLGISKDLKKFAKETSKYGTIGKTEVSWKETKAGVEKTYKKVVPDTMPTQVKQTLLDVERLSELKGEAANEGGIPLNPAREREIAEIEERLSKAPQELKDFADRFSQLNKGVEEMGVKLGVTKQEWLDALNEDPRWQKYMTRQALTPGGARTASPGGSVNPSDPAILTKSRKGYYADNYLDPMLSLSMKVESLGRAYAWNERAKMVVDFQLAQGKIAAGKGSVEAAKRLEEVKAEIKGRTDFRKQIGYDDEAKTFSKDMDTISNAFNRINDLLNAPEKINLKSVYDATTNPRIKNMVNDFETGKIQFGEGVVEAAGLSDSDAATIIRNTYSYQGNKLTKDTDIEGSMPKVDFDYSAGMTDSGVPYKYNVENGKITSLEEITDAEGLAKSISGISGNYSIATETVEGLGAMNTHAINRTLLFYRDNLPTISENVVFRVGREDGAPYGWCPKVPATIRVENGKLVADEFEVFLDERWYAKGKEQATIQRYIQDGRFHPKGATDLSSTPIHENGHSTTGKLTMADINRRLENGELTLPEYATSGWGLKDFFIGERDKIQADILDKAMGRIGIKNTPENLNRQRETISGYAGYPKDVARRNSETIAEAVSDYAVNGGNSSPFTVAIIEEMRERLQRYTGAASPAEVFKKNNLDAPKGLFTESSAYNFPASAKTDVQKGKWLDKYRQDNPYIKGKGLMTEEDYQKANLWDTYFQKEIRVFDPNSKTSMPDALAKKNGEFLENLASNSAKMMVEEIKKASIDGFSEELATMALSRNSKDINDAMESFIVQRINKSAQEIAKKMPGGDTLENLNKARATLWSDTGFRDDTVTMMSRLVPDAGIKDIQSMIGGLFEQQAKGFATFGALDIDTQKLLGEQLELKKELDKNNNYALKQGREADKTRTGYVGDTTQMIHYKQGGEDVYVMVSDPVTASILKRPAAYKDTGVAVEALAQTANFLSRTYRIGTTGISPLAFVRNVLRDPMQATIQGGFNPLNMSLSPDVFYHTLRNYGLDDDTIAEVTTRLKNWAAGSTLTQEMRDMGSITPSQIGYRNNVERATRKLDKITNSKIIEAMEAPLDTWESMFRNQIAQQSFTKNFERTRDVNKAMGAAMFDASNSTTNFSHSVGLFKRATSTVPYLSSAINGTRSFWTQFNVDPIGMITRITAGFMVPAMAITAWNLSNDERKKAYANLPEWYRDSHIVLLDLDGNIISFPIPEEIQQFYGTARRLIEYTNDVNQQGIPAILAQGAFGFLPVDVDGYFKADGSIDMGRGTVQMLSGLMPQAVTAIYEFIAEKDLYTGEDISYYDGLNKAINTLSNIFGSGVKNWANDIGMMMGASSKQLVGKSTAETLARDLFGMGFNEATNQFMAMIGSPSEVDPDTGKETKATGLFKESEDLQSQIEGLDKKIATSTGDQKKEYEDKKAELIDNFTERVGNLVHNYMDLYSQTGGLEDWQKAKIVSILTLGKSFSSARSDSYQYQDSSEAFLTERSLAQQRYLQAGLPGGASRDTILQGNDSIAVQAALNRFYGVPKQAGADFKNALEESGLKNIRNQFFDAVEKIYDLAEETGTEPDYDMIEKIQARYLQAVDNILIPIVQNYGINILNNNDFIDEVRRYVNGMIPSDDWRQSIRNKKKFLSKKDYPMATVDVKKWLIDRYSNGMRNRNIASDAEVTERLKAIKEDIDAGRSGAAKGRIDDLFSGVRKANFYISSEDMQTLNQYNNMLK